ncbi:Carbonic anhydrase (Carbonate dehydratase), partial [Durusdinium trenchii]
SPKAAQRQSRGLHGSCTLEHKHTDQCRHFSTADEMKRKVDEYMKEHGDDVPELKGSHPELEDVLAGNQAWVDKMNETDPDFFKRLTPQNPRYLYLGCSDARVDPIQLMGLEYGALFVHRNVGNQVAPNDLNILSVIDFSVNVLKVPHIVVCGHYDCGAVRGSVAKPDAGGLGLVENWLRNIRDVARLHHDELKALPDPETRHRRLVELNVMEQCLNVLKVGTVQRARMKSHVIGQTEVTLPRVHGLVFDPADGVLHKLKVDFGKVEQYGDLYDLYQVPDWAKSQ